MLDRIVRSLSITMLALIVFLAAAAVSVSAATKLTLWAWANQEVMEQFASIAEWYQAENPDVEIEIAHIAGSQLQYTERFYLVSAGGAAPDVAWIEGSTVKQLAAQGLLQDVTEALEDIRFTPGETYEMIFAGRMYAAPYHCTSRGLLKRIDLLEQAGPIRTSRSSWMICGRGTKNKRHLAGRALHSGRIYTLGRELHARG